MLEDDKKGWECNASSPFLNDNEKKLRLAVILIYFDQMETYHIEMAEKGV